jgi:hypothetical protein
LKYRGEPFAEVWFKPEGEPHGLAFRIPQESFRLPGMDQLLTPENLVRAVGVAAEEVDSWRPEGAGQPAVSGSDPGLRQPLTPPSADVAHLILHVSLKQRHQADEGDRGGEPAVSEAKWQALEARWQSVLGLEASIDTLRISMEGLRSELESASSRALTPDEKVHALNADVAQWTKAKSRATYSLPKLREFIHRATWATGAPERKELEETLENHVRPRVPFPGLGQLMDKLDSLLKDRQVLSAIGVSVYQECKGVSVDIQGALRTLQGNAASNATKKRAATIKKGKSLR